MYEANMTICLSLIDSTEASLYQALVCAHYAVRNSTDSMSCIFPQNGEISQESALTVIRLSRGFRRMSCWFRWDGRRPCLMFWLSWIRCSPMLRPRRICCDRSSTQRSRFALLAAVICCAALLCSYTFQVLSDHGLYDVYI